MEEISPESEEIYVKEEHLDYEIPIIKIGEEYLERDHHPDHKNLDKT